MINSIKRIMYCQTAVITALVGNLLYILQLKYYILIKLKTRSTKSKTEDSLSLSLSPSLLVWKTNIKLTSVIPFGVCESTLLKVSVLLRGSN